MRSSRRIQHRLPFLQALSWETSHRTASIAGVEISYCLSAHINRETHTESHTEDVRQAQILRTCEVYCEHVERMHFTDIVSQMPDGLFAAVLTCSMTIITVQRSCACLLRPVKSRSVLRSRRSYKTTSTMTASGLSKTDVVEGHPNDMKGKNIVVTGGNSGIGLALSKALASRGANVTIATRNSEKGSKCVHAPGCIVVCMQKVHVPMRCTYNLRITCRSTTDRACMHGSGLRSVQY